MPRGPEPKTPRPAWSTALRARRISLDLKQEEVSARTEDVISQGTVSDLERGKVALVNLTAPRLVALAGALGWSLEEMEVETGIKLTTSQDATPEPRLSSRSAALSAGALYKNIPRQEEPLDEALLEAARLYGGSPEFAELADPTMQRALQNIDFKARPQTAQEWLAKFVKYKDDLRSGHDA